MSDFLPYGRQTVDEQDIAEVADVLRSDWLTTGPKITEFEAALCDVTGAKFCVAVSSGTAALHAAYNAAGVGSDSEVIVPPLTFSATANAARYLQASVAFADIDPSTLTIDPWSVETCLNERTRAIVAVDYAGLPADYDELRAIADRANVALIADACHAIGGRYRSRPVGSLADLTCFSFHPVKHVTTGEGGAVVTDDEEMATRMRRFRTHGMERDVTEVGGEPVGGWGYDIRELGYNYRITDFQCALGLSQLRHLDEWVEKRRQVAAAYDELLDDIDGVTAAPTTPAGEHAYHLYPVRVAPEIRRDVFEGLRDHGIGVQVHYIPVNALALYRARGHSPEQTPNALEAYRGLISLPIFPRMTRDDVDRVVKTVRQLL